MSTELLIAGEGPEMAARPPWTLGVRELGEVAIPCAEANSVLVTVLWISIDMVLQLVPRREDFGAVVAFCWLGRRWFGNELSGYVDDSRHFDKCVDL